MNSPLLLTISTTSPAQVKLQASPACKAMGVTTICESNLQRFTAMGEAKTERLVENLANSADETEIWSAAFYSELPIEAAEIQPYSRAQRGLPCLFSQIGELPGIEDGDRFPVGEQWPLSCTDQERAFCLLQERIRKLWSEGRPDAEVKLALIADYAGRLNRLAGHHFIHWDGELLFVYSGHDTALEPLAFQSFSNTGFCLKNEMGLDLKVQESISGIIIGTRSLLGESAQTVPAGSTLCFRNGELYEQCDAVNFWERIE